MENIPSKLFHKPGYISLKEYLDDIDHMRRNGPWKLPLGRGDRLHLFLLSMIAKFSWLSDNIFMQYPYTWSPAYSVLVLYLRRGGLFEEIVEKDAHIGGNFSFFTKKKVFINERMFPIRGRGGDSDIATAFSKVLGETIERVVTGLLDSNEKIRKASPVEMEKKHAFFYPPRYHRFLDVQKEYYRELRHDPSRPIDWVLGNNLITREETYIPYQITSWFGFGEARIFRDRLVSSTSNGCAGYFTRVGAVLRGLLEAVNRDAFFVHWLTMIPPKVLVQETLPSDIQEMIREFASRGITLSIVDVTALPIPSVYIVAINENASTPRIALSGSAATTYGQAIRDALQEMVAVSDVFYRNDRLEPDEKWENIEPFVSDINSFTRQLYWTGHKKIEKFRWFLSGESVSYDVLCDRDLPNGGADDGHQLRACLAVLKKLGEGYYPVVYYPKHPVQEEVGFYIAQVYIPKAFPLYLFECYGTFDSDRLYEFALSKNVTSWQLNPFPHPFS